MEITEFRKLTLISGSFANILNQLVEKNNDPIATEVLRCNTMVNLYKENPDYDITQDVTDVARHITIKAGQFNLSFLPEGKDPEFTNSGNWSTKNRQLSKPGKLLQKLLVKTFENKQYEQFFYALKGFNTLDYTFEIVKGEKIRDCYLCDNYYSEINTLGCSCMRYWECQDYFDIYTEQEECSMLVAFRDGKVAGRAIVWTIDGKTYMDRVYYIEDCLYNMFIDYAEQHNWWHLLGNSYVNNNSMQSFVGPEDDYTETYYPSLTIKLHKIYDTFPYMDSFRYLNIDNKTISTDPEGAASMLCNTGGEWSENVCPICGEYCDEDDMYYSDIEGISGCGDCLVWCDRLDDYIRAANGVPYTAENGYVEYDYPEYLQNDPDIICINNHYYHKNSGKIKQSLLTGKWTVK